MMKKLAGICLTAGMLVACTDNGSSTVDTKVDSVKESIDSNTAAKIDTLKDSADRLKDKVEATYEKTDSANKANIDSLKKK